MIPKEKYSIIKQYNLSNINHMVEFNELNNRNDVYVIIKKEEFDKVGRYQIVCEIKVDTSNEGLIKRLLGKE